MQTWDLKRPVRVLPDQRYKAEVLVLLTTLGANRAEFNAGKRVRDLLEVKRVHHQVIDFNRETWQAGNGEAEAIQTLVSQNKLKVRHDGRFVSPQIFVDGVCVDSADELQALEDDGDLEGMLLRQTCIQCAKARAPGASTCESCSAEFVEVLPNAMAIKHHLPELSDHYDKANDTYAAEDCDDKEGMSRKLQPLHVSAVQLPTSGVETRGRVTFYTVEVVPEGGAAPWQVKRRYNDFLALADKLGHTAKKLPDAPFPKKHSVSSLISSRRRQAQLEARRGELEVWLVRVLENHSSAGLWLQALHEFFEVQYERPRE